jgi:hypothetical protein
LPQEQPQARALLREQVATVVGLLVYLFVAEPIMTRVPALRGWTIYLPGSASAALTQGFPSRPTLSRTVAGRAHAGRLRLRARGRCAAADGPPRRHLTCD